MDYTDAVLATVAVFLLAWYYTSNTKRRPPAPIGIPILGYLPFIGGHPAKKYYELSKKYGPVISVKLGPETFTVLNDYATIQEVSNPRVSLVIHESSVTLARSCIH